MFSNSVEREYALCQIDPNNLVHGFRLKGTEDCNVSTAGSRRVGEFVLIGLHMAFAAFLLLMSFFTHGRVPGLSADASAALGYLFFFGLGLPILLIAVGTFACSLLARERWLSALAVLLLATVVLAITNVWVGVLASLIYLSLSVWSLVQRLRTPPNRDPAPT